ncbi:MAG: glycosyltransferase family A protein [Thermincola sp.]|nr:glycosyltransferase family A protein [Thermincola sp.]MDT3703445.1 glycosyltransferase family A protein [Thermincola sp.]
MRKPIISVVVCTFNREELLPCCLQSLVDQTLDKSLYEVIVVNNNSTDSTELIAQSFVDEQENFSLVVAIEQGLSHARNRGWQEAKGDYIAYIDDDAKACPDWCERILRAFKTVASNKVCVGGPIFAWFETSPPKWFPEDFESFDWGDNPGFIQPPRSKFGFCGSNMVIPKNILQEYGGFSVDYGMVGEKMGLAEESHFFFKLYKDNYLFWYDPKMIVEHWVPVFKVKMKYILKRAFTNGVTQAKMEGQISLINFAKNTIKFFGAIVLGVTVRVSWFSKDRKKCLVRNLQSLSRKLGYLIQFSKFK